MPSSDGDAGERGAEEPDSRKVEVRARGEAGSMAGRGLAVLRGEAGWMAGQRRVLGLGEVAN